MATKVDFIKKTLAVITGSSQGIGRTIALELAKKLGVGSAMLLLARSEKGLNETKDLISKVNDNVTVLINPVDLSKVEVKDCDKIFKTHLSPLLSGGGFENGVIFHNAGQIGTLAPTTELTDISKWRNYYDLNLFSVALLNSSFVKCFKAKVQKLLVVNVTSLCGSKPFEHMAMYGSGKAARDLFFKVLAVEEPEVIVLNYSPGPVDTAMVGEIVDKMKNPKIKGVFTELLEKKTILTTEQTVCKMLGIIEDGRFNSGDIVDYYDRI